MEKEEPVSNASNRTPTKTLLSVKADDQQDDEDGLSNFGSPKRGPTLSTSTSSFEALDPHDPHLSHLASLMFSHTSDYLQVYGTLYICFLVFKHLTSPIKN